MFQKNCLEQILKLNETEDTEEFAHEDEQKNEIHNHGDSKSNSHNSKKRVI